MGKILDRTNETIVDFFIREGWWWKREELCQFIEEGKLTVNSKKIKSSYIPKQGDEIRLWPYSFKVSQ